MNRQGWFGRPRASSSNQTQDGSRGATIRAGRCAPFGADEVRLIVESELGARISRAFIEFEAQPFASASISQVQRATTHNGRKVAVKIQRPDIQSQFYQDIDLLQKVAGVVDRTTRVGKRLKTRQIMGEFRKVVTRELFPD